MDLEVRREESTNETLNFKEEIDIVLRLEHFKNGLSYFVMKLVDNTPMKCLILFERAIYEMSFAKMPLPGIFDNNTTSILELTKAA